ncbi:HAUS augmin-like complex subunit 1, partial [Merops nubicus]
QVYLWLKKICGVQPVPEGVLTAETVDTLHELSKYDEATDKDISFLIEDMKERATWYEAEAKNLENIFTEHLGIHLYSLSSEGILYLDDLVRSAMILETKDASLTSLFSAINDMTLELHETESKNREMRVELAKMREKLASVLMLEMHLEQDLQKSKEDYEVQKAKNKERFLTVDFLQMKSLELQTSIDDAQEKIVASGLDQSLTHESLVNLSEELKELKKQIEPLKQEMESYADLPPVI